MKRLAIVISHPIQYFAPLFKLLAERKNIEIKVFYTWGDAVLENKYDPGFKKNIAWDIPLLDGYQYEFLQNISTDKGTHHFKGIINPDIISRIDNFSPDAILVYGWAFHSHLKVLRHYKKKKLILFRGDSTLLNRKTFYKEFIRIQFLKWVYRYIDYALYVGKNNYDYYKKIGLKEQQLIYAPHAIDNERFLNKDKSYKESANALRHQLNIPAGDIVFLFAGKFEDTKNPSILLHSFVQFVTNKTVKLVMVGNGNLEKQLKEESKKFTSISFLDFQNQSQMPTIYNMADIFVLPSKGETWGLVINEAMACSIPILVSDKCGCAPDLVSNGENGYIFKSEDANSLVDKMNSLISLGKDGLSEMGKCSRKRIQEFSFEKFCEVTESLIL